MTGRQLEEFLYRAGYAGLIVFLSATVLEHVIQPSLDPSRHQISEYANGRGGALRTAGFLGWAASLASTGRLAATSARARVLPLLLYVAGTGILVTACFPTQTSAGDLPPGEPLSTTGAIHNLGSGITTAALLAAVLASSLSCVGTRRSHVGARRCSLSSWVLTSGCS